MGVICISSDEEEADRAPEEEKHEKEQQEHEEIAGKTTASNTVSNAPKKRAPRVHHTIVKYVAEATGYLSVGPKELLEIVSGDPVQGDPRCTFPQYVFGRKCADGTSGWLPFDVMGTVAWERYAANGRPWRYNPENEDWQWEDAAQ